ncbi:hypothetical protein FGO82_01470, partial [Streptococcus pyogenes]
LSIFDEIKHYAVSEIEPRTQRQLSADDFDYLFLIYLTADNSFLTDYWTADHREQLFNVIAEDSDYRLLASRLQALVGDHYDITQHMSSLLPFFRRTLYNLQTLITFDGYYSDQYQGNTLLLEKIKTIIKDWLADTGRQGNLSMGHLHLMCLLFEQILENSVNPIAITIVESQETIGDVITLFISSTVPAYKIDLSRLNILSENIYHYDKPVDLVVTSQNLMPFLKELKVFPKETCLIGLS